MKAKMQCGSLCGGPTAHERLRVTSETKFVEERSLDLATHYCPMTLCIDSERVFDITFYHSSRKAFSLAGFSTLQLLLLSTIESDAHEEGISGTPSYSDLLTE